MSGASSGKSEFCFQRLRAPYAARRFVARLLEREVGPRNPLRGAWHTTSTQTLLQVISEEAWLGPPCARRTTTASPWGFREQGGPSQAGLLLLSPSR